jgi:hypothetical protein
MAVDIAKDAAPALTDETQSAFASSKSVYGEARPLGVNGQPLTLDKTGATKAGLKFVHNGTVVRCVLGPPYAKYLIRYGILPNGPLPVGWSRRIDGIVSEYKAVL